MEFSVKEENPLNNKAWTLACFFQNLEQGSHFDNITLEYQKLIGMFNVRPLMEIRFPVINQWWCYKALSLEIKLFQILLLILSQIYRMILNYQPLVGVSSFSFWSSNRFNLISLIFFIIIKIQVIEIESIILRFK